MKKSPASPLKIGADTPELAEQMERVYREPSDEALEYLHPRMSAFGRILAKIVVLVGFLVVGLVAFVVVALLVRWIARWVAN